MTLNLRKYSSLVALPHSVFALPFALASFHLASVLTPSAERSLTQLILVVLAVIAARTAAMGFNRIVDADIDALNPRTKNRELPAGAVSAGSAKALVALSLLIFLCCAAALGTHCLLLSPLVILILLGYSYAKRHTQFSHLILGLALAAAPGGAWWVLRPHVEATPLLLMGAVLFWVAGFDVLYSCQDSRFDREHKLYSIPARWGLPKALLAAKLLHLVSFTFFMAVGLSAHLAPSYFWGMSLIGLLFLGQHLLIRADDLSRINHAFFTLNGCVSIVYFLLVLFAST